MRMDRREFLKSAAALAAFGAAAKLVGADLIGTTQTGDGKSPQVTRRPYRKTGITLPLLGFGLMRLPTKDGQVDFSTAEKMVEMAMKAGCNYFDPR